MTKFKITASEKKMILAARKNSQKLMIKATKDLAKFIKKFEKDIKKEKDKRYLDKFLKPDLLKFQELLKVMQTGDLEATIKFTKTIPGTPLQQMPDSVLDITGW